ncbi:MAG: protein-L-isoaspartate(D-aspartate) O-methyltransferase [Candidatus Omnitrophota bacterium]|nr:protein-L-isoaspartate(D-aspartate) O-methyltransferase [Candidatus Omnitrophota bacterium]
MRGLLILAMALLLSGAGNRPRLTEEEKERMEDRKEMVEEQVRQRGVTDLRVLKAMETVPRELFVPRQMRNMAFMDGPLPIGGGQTISQPYVVGLMTQLAEVGPEDKVLEIGTGSGYQAAVLAELTDKVFSIEILPELAAQAANRLKSLGYDQIRLRTGDGYAGWPEEAPFDAILVTAAPESVPQPLTDQLAEGGVLVMPLGPRAGYQELICIRKKEGKLERETITSVSFVPLIRGKEDPRLSDRT